MPALVQRLVLAVLGAVVLGVGMVASSLVMPAGAASPDATEPATETARGVPASQPAAPVRIDHPTFLAERIGGIECVGARTGRYGVADCVNGDRVVGLRGADGVCYRPAAAPALDADTVITVRLGDHLLDLCLDTDGTGTIDVVAAPIAPPRRTGPASDANCADENGVVFVGLDDLHRLDTDDNGLGCDEHAA